MNLLKNLITLLILINACVIISDISAVSACPYKTCSYDYECQRKGCENDECSFLGFCESPDSSKSLGSRKLGSRK